MGRGREGHSALGRNPGGPISQNETLGILKMNEKL